MWRPLRLLSALGRVRRNGLSGFRSVAIGSANGVVGVNSSPQGAGVLGVGAAGTGVSAEGRTGVDAEGTDYGVSATGDISALLIGGDPSAHPCEHGCNNDAEEQPCQTPINSTNSEVLSPS